MIADRLSNEVRTVVVVVVIGAAVDVPVLLVRRHPLHSRLGTFEPAPQRRRRTSLTRPSLLLLVNAVVVFGAGAYFLNVPRFYLHGVLFGSAMPILIWPDLVWGVDVQVWLVLRILGSAIIGVGLRKLIQLTWDDLGSHLARLEEAGQVSIIKGCNGRKPETTISATALGRATLIEHRDQLLIALAPVEERTRGVSAVTPSELPRLWW